MTTCENCGCRVYSGVCSNCHEELYIVETQGEYIDHLSDEFAAKVREQREEVKRKSDSGSVK